MLLRKALVSDRGIEDNCLLGFVLWRDNPSLFICMHGTTVSQKSRQDKVYVNRSIFSRCIMALQLCRNIKRWLNIARTLLRADYIGLLMFEVR